MALLSPFEVSVRSSKLAVREALKSLLQSLSPLHLDTKETGTVELVVAEALNNIIEHAYQNDASRGPIMISCAHRADGLHLQITDEGDRMPGKTTPPDTKVPPNVNINDPPEGGFGWFLINDLAKDVIYQRVGLENQLSIRIAVALKPSSCRS